MTARNENAALWAAWRSNVAKRDGYRCWYCRVPTAATIEHVAPLSSDARSSFENLRIACPYCNSTKSDEPVESFREREGWKIDIPSDLPATVREMLAQEYGWESEEGRVFNTGSTNSRILLEDDFVYVEIRARKLDPWLRLALGLHDNPKVVKAAWLFARRHNTRRMRKR